MNCCSAMWGCCVGSILFAFFLNLGHYALALIDVIVFVFCGGGDIHASDPRCGGAELFIVFAVAVVVGVVAVAGLLLFPVCCCSLYFRSFAALPRLAEARPPRCHDPQRDPRSVRLRSLREARDGVDQVQRSQACPEVRQEARTHDAIERAKSTRGG